MKSAIPREIVNSCGCFEEDDRRARGKWLVVSDEFRHCRNLEIVEPADESAFDALGEKFFHPVFTNRYFFHTPILPINPLLHP